MGTGIFSPQFVLGVTRVEPSSPIEHQPMRIFFSLRNRTDNTVSGSISSPQGGIVQISDLAPRETTTGSFVSSAPAAATSALVEIDFFQDPIPDLPDIPQPTAQGFARIDVGANYIAKIDNFEIFHTRALHEDTDFVGIQVRVGDQPVLDDPDPTLDPMQPSQPQPVHWRRMGDVNDGVHPVGLEIGPFTAFPNSKVGFHFQIQNSGFDLGTLVAFLNKVSTAAAGILEIVFKGSDWHEANELTQFINNEQFANCDGIVALDFILRTGDELQRLTSEDGGHTETRRFPGVDIGPKEFEIYRSAAGCGAERSDYAVTYTFQRVSFQSAG